MYTYPSSLEAQYHFLQVVLNTFYLELSDSEVAYLMQVNENLHPHLADFGLAEYMKDLKQVSVQNWKSSGKPTGGFHKKNMVGTLIYMAPEVLRKEMHTEKSDVYSFGVTVK